jgi:hypothetical protein
VVAREKLLDWERLWDDFTQEELRVDSSQAIANQRVKKRRMLLFMQRRVVEEVLET